MNTTTFTLEVVVTSDAQQFAQQHGLGEAGIQKFPLLAAFHLLTQATSNTAQSASYCTAEYTLAEWEQLEARLAKLPVGEFVAMALDLDTPSHPWARPEFVAWAHTWE
jgi:hypothetical protein